MLAAFASAAVVLMAIAVPVARAQAPSAASSAPSSSPQEAVVAPNENLVVDGVPPVPAAIAERASRYTNFRNALFTSWNPTRREMLIATRFGDTFQIHKVASPGAARTQLTFYSDSVRSAFYPPKVATGAGDSFVFSKDIGGGEFYQIYRYDVATGAITMLTDGKSRNTDEIWSHDGARLAYGSTKRNGNDVDIWVTDPWHPESATLVVQNAGGGFQPADFSPDGSQLLLLEYISANETNLYIANLATGEKTQITPAQLGGKDAASISQKVAYGTAAFSRDGKGVFLTTDKDSEFQRLAYFDLATKQFKFLTTDIKWDVEGFDLSPDGTQIAFTVNEDGYGSLHILDTRTGKEHTLAGIPAGIATGAKWHRNGEDLAFGLTSARTPYDSYSVNVKTGKVDRWTFSETGGLNAQNFADAQLVHWKSFDGKLIGGFLYKPVDAVGKPLAGKHPVIIDIHGGPEGQFRPGFLARNNYLTSELGIAVIYPNVRGSTGYGKEFVTLDNGFLREDSYKDINALFDWIATQPDLDASRIMVTGGSYGGFMTLAVATNYNDRIRCSVDIVGPSNLVTFLENTSGYRRDLRRVEYGDERDPKMREFLERIAPANNATKITKPLYVIQGRNDPRVPHTEAEQMVAVVRKQGTPVWFLMANDEGHGFAKKNNVDFQFYSTILFIQKYLLN
jgi:dipeptidyl aminopeptidase/acylaminoacyl peptidase